MPQLDRMCPAAMCLWLKRGLVDCHTASLKPTKLARCRTTCQWCRLWRFADLRATNQTHDIAARNKTGWHAPLAFRILDTTRGSFEVLYSFQMLQQGASPTLNRYRHTRRTQRNVVDACIYIFQVDFYQSDRQQNAAMDRSVWPPQSSSLTWMNPSRERNAFV